MEKKHLAELDVTEFVFQLSSRKPTPGGGGASALAGALGIALGGMVANLTIGKPNYANADDEMKKLKVSAYRVQKELLELIQKDADGFDPLAGAYRMPSGTDEEKAEKARVMEAALKDAAENPLAIMERCAEALELLEALALRGNRLAVSDAGCGAALCRAAMQSAWLNVAVNTVAMRDAEYAARLNDRGSALLGEYLPRAEKLYCSIEEGFRRT
ncbi:MAG: cyclodeaminase/cyclohydrolase family protein [Clostridiales Family XIII bacterium]|jgi:formiminotetrahydrofolate cyclodeaminase|nr:cyclodeaminase/cyclohydrolase family protein [Clostridiales Family XIII bacterium]